MGLALLPCSDRGRAPRAGTGGPAAASRGDGSRIQRRGRLRPPALPRGLGGETGISVPGWRRRIVAPGRPGSPCRFEWPSPFTIRRSTRANAAFAGPTSPPAPCPGGPGGGGLFVAGNPCGRRKPNRYTAMTGAQQKERRNCAFGQRLEFLREIPGKSARSVRMSEWTPRTASGNPNGVKETG